VKKTDAVKKAREYADAGCRSGKDRIDCNGCIDDLAKLIEEVHAAGKREGIEAAAKIPGLSTVMITNIRALLRMEEKKP
jgi:hypothetical protein